MHDTMAHVCDAVGVDVGIMFEAAKEMCKGGGMVRDGSNWFGDGERSRCQWSCLEGEIGGWGGDGRYGRRQDEADGAVVVVASIGERIERYFEGGRASIDGKDQGRHEGKTLAWPVRSRRIQILGES